ncbi:MAG TPA: hypothetical protein PKA14_22260 [Leptospiraceae bacterium]|nr:hypothetical protein [Leptospiraceae bacterium]
MKTLDEILEKTFYFSSLGSLRNFISWIDNEICMNPEDTLLLQVLAVSVKTLGEELVKPGEYDAHHPVRSTLKSADEYANDPTQENWNQFFSDSTDSYPFGPGDGCYSIVSGCEAGSGCRSGAGSLLFTLESIPGLTEEKAISLIHHRIELLSKGEL